MAQRLIAVAGLVVLACGSSQTVDSAPTPTRPLPVGAMIGVQVVVYPLTMVAAEGALEWTDLLEPRLEALRRADSMIGEALANRTPEVTWVEPDALRRAARQAPGMFTNPDRMATAALRYNLDKVPDPLRSQMRILTAVAGDRMALVPASLLFFHEPDGPGRAELTLVLVDVRLGEIRWRSVARGNGSTPWAALDDALDALMPGLL